MVSELNRNRILNRLPPFSDEFFDNVYDVLLTGLKILYDDKVYEMAFWDPAKDVVNLYDPKTEQRTEEVEIAACAVWNEWTSTRVCGLQTMLDCLETWMPTNG